MRTSIWKRALSLVLSLAMLLSLVPAMGMVQEAEALTDVTIQETGFNYITLPITIRDFAADGMLFEYNEVNTSTYVLYDENNKAYLNEDANGNPVSTPNTVVINETSVTHNVEVNPEYWDFKTGTYTGIRVVVPNSYYSVFDDTYAAGFSGTGWYCVICDSSGNVVKVLSRSDEKNESGIYESAMTTYNGAFSIWAWYNNADDDSNYAAIAAITEENKGNYQITLSNANSGSWDSTYAFASTITISEGERRTYHQADTQAFGLLQTDINDYINNLNELQITEDASTLNIIDSTIIAGTQIVKNGSYGSSATPTVLKSPLYSSDDRTTPYAYQDIYGAYVRTNLVDKELDANGNPQYTRETVEFLAEFMEQIMAVPEQNEDGSYNTYFVTGDKVFDAGWNLVPKNGELAVYTLADMIRMTMDKYKAETVEKYGNTLGTYEDAKAKFESGGLESAYFVRTWCEAAYYLLHSTFYDSRFDMSLAGSDGYGMHVPRYDQLHMVEKTNETTGEIYYEFNARYENTVYNYNSGEIFNSQVTNFSRSQLDGEDFYTYGNLLPEDRFDPLGESGSGLDLGYGMSGDVYGDMTNQHPTWPERYDNTNYNLTLEGHAKFVYHTDSNQYFTFTGDDDVYLYINGVRVLDIGGAHSISKVKININDVAEVCGLTDGGTYDFDFFFMERHGTAANLGIETNIQLADPAMTTTKTGYQDGVSTGYNGYVDPKLHVGYSFELQNDSDVQIYDLTFKDEDIGVYFGYDGIQLYPEGFTDAQKELYGMDDLYLIYWDDAGNFSEYLRPGSVTEDVIKERLTAGLEPGERIGIYGFKYHITEAGEYNTKYGTNYKTWTDNTFTNTVHTTAKARTGSKEVELHGMSDWVVQKMEVPYTAFHVYDWVHKDINDTEWETPTGGTVTLSKRELLQYLIDAGLQTEEQVNALVSNAGVTISRCTASGHEEDYLQNPCVTVNEDNSITYTSAQPGLDTVFYEIRGTGLLDGKLDDLPFSFDVYTYGTMDNLYVLDYGLKVELNGENYGYRVNDHLEVPQNNNNPTVTHKLVSKSEDYGQFTYPEDLSSIVYTPTRIINKTDYFAVDITVREPNADTTKPLKYYGVDMSETVTTAPANVVYYEENFPGITYMTTENNEWVQYETQDGEGNSLTGDEQSADQDSNYGSDPNYETDKNGITTESEEEGNTIVLLPSDTELSANAHENLKDFLGVGGADSNGTVRVMEVKETADVMMFEFVGTGFEIISRTTDSAYAIVMATVYKITRTYDAEGNETGRTETRVRAKPVITESVGGDLYQVPIISITGLEHGEYKVVLKASGTYMAGTEDEVRRVLYIDGIRIYNPLDPDGDEVKEYYNPEEAGAQFLEIKKLIGDGQVVYCAAEADEVTDDTGETGDTGETEGTGPEPAKTYSLATGGTYIENILKSGLLIEIDDLSAYLKNGPNNELYLNGESYANLLAFYIEESSIAEGQERTLQIGAHRKIDSNTSSTGAVTLAYGSTAEAFLEETNTVKIKSGTEIYHTIDVSKLAKDEFGRYLVMIGTNSEVSETLVLTNLKVTGYNVVNVEDALKDFYEEPEEGKEAPAVVNELLAIYKVLHAEVMLVKDLIKAGQILHIDSNAGSYRIITGNSILTEKDGAFVETEIGEDDNYPLSFYKDRVMLNGDNLIAFYVTPDTEVMDEARTLQIAAQSDGEVALIYGSNAVSIGDEDNSEPINGTYNTYYTIDVDCLTEVNGRYLVLIAVNSASDAELALTRLKVSGYDIEVADMNGTDSAVQEALKILDDRIAAESSEEEDNEPEMDAVDAPEEQEPEVTGDAWTEDEETEPEATEAEWTDFAETIE